jgi:hypothetical protein
MSDFPNIASLPVTVWTGSKFSMGAGTRAPLAGTGQYATAAWTTANLAMYVPFWLPFRYPIRNLFVFNFATVNGTHDLGIYDRNFALITSTGSVTQAGTSTIQFHAKDIILDPGQYYFALSSSSTTATYATMQSGTTTRHRYLGILQQTSAHPLPASATPASISAGNVKITAMGFTHLSSPVF